MQKRYPFKYLDAYTRNDKEFYFGRNEEVQQLYEMTFQSNLLVVYGASGTGKTSLIQCGLANRFTAYEWLAVPIRRGVDVNQSLEQAILDEIGDDADYFDEDASYVEFEAENSPIGRQIKTLWLKYFKPVHLIFDQFEELYILNANKKEQNDFYQTVKQLLALPQPVKIIISIREEYLGHLCDFERIVPDLLRKKLRVEAMTLEKVSQVLHGINNPAISLITLQNGAENDLIHAIFDKLREDRISIELPYLQVLLDKLYLNLTNNDEKHTSEAVLTCDALERTGAIGGILFSLLDGLVLQLKKEKQIEPETSWKTLSRFVSIEGTKEPHSSHIIQEQLLDIDIDVITETLQFFVSKRILRYDPNTQVYEIAHDALAKQIHANRSVEELACLQIKKLLQEKLNKSVNLNEILTEKQLKEIDFYSGHLTLSDGEKELITKSRNEVEKVERQKRRTLRNTRLALVIAGVFLFISFWQWMESNRAKKNVQKAKNETEIALTQANKLINVFYFYDDKFALANNQGIFYYIDKNGDKIEKLGTWRKAEQFDYFSGFAKVVGDQDTKMYALDTLGNIYRYTNNIAELDSSIQVLDLSGQSLFDFPKEIALFTNLIYLDLRENQLFYLPPEIKKLSNLKELNLSGNELTILPPEIGELMKLKNLNLSYNQLSEIPFEVKKLKNLEVLSLSNNPLNGLLPEIGELKSLKNLFLDHIQLKLLPPEIGQLTKLENLHLGGNQLNNLPPEIGNLTNLTFLSLRASKLTLLPPEIGNLSNLSYLFLGENQLGLLPPEIGKLSKLLFLELSRNELKDLPSEISQLSNLETLNLSNNNLGTIPPEIGRLVQLSALYLDGNQLKYLPPTIGKLINLEYLSLVNNQFVEFPYDIRKMKKLRVLDLGYNMLQFFPSEIEKLTNLKVLSLYNNLIREIPTETIGKMKNLEEIELRGNPLTNLSEEFLKIDNLNILESIGKTFYEQKRYHEAEKYQLRCLQISEAIAKEKPYVFPEYYYDALYSLFQTYQELNDYLAVIQYLSACNDLLSAYEVEYSNTSIAENLRYLSWYYLLTKDYKKAEQSIRQALEINSHSFKWPKGGIVNLAHALLFQNRFLESEVIYSELKKSLSSTFLKDLDLFENAGVIPESCKTDVERIRKMLKEK